MTYTPHAHALTPLERLRLRDSLQDEWRDQVRRITELSVELHGALGDDREHGFNRSASISFAISEARMRLTEIEDEMRRLDETTAVPGRGGQ